MNNSAPLLSAESLSLTISGHPLLKGISFSIDESETVALVGESGSGKSMTAKAILRFVAGISGKILFKGIDLLQLKEKDMRLIRGQEIGLICQNSMTALNPTLSIGAQLSEGMMVHRQLTKKQASKEAADLLDRVGMKNPAHILTLYPDQLSGGMRQRVVIAIAISSQPSLLIADEPTSSLDTSTQAQILDCLSALQRDFKMGMLLISHDLGIVANYCEKILILQDGAIVDQGTVNEIVHQSQHPYTRELCWKR